LFTYGEFAADRAHDGRRSCRTSGATIHIAFVRALVSLRCSLLPMGNGRAALPDFGLATDAFSAEREGSVTTCEERFADPRSAFPDFPIPVLVDRLMRQAL